MDDELYDACVNDKRKCVGEPSSCENALEDHNYPCSQMCPCNLRDSYIALYDAYSKIAPPFPAELEE